MIDVIFVTVLVSLFNVVLLSLSFRFNQCPIITGLIDHFPRYAFIRLLLAPPKYSCSPAEIARVHGRGLYSPLVGAIGDAKKWKASVEAEPKDNVAQDLVPFDCG